MLRPVASAPFCVAVCTHSQILDSNRPCCSPPLLLLLYSALMRVGPADLWRDTPLCMAQYRRLFGAHRKAVENDADEMRVCEVRRGGCGKIYMLLILSADFCCCLLSSSFVGWELWNRHASCLGDGKRAQPLANYLGR